MFFSKISDDWREVESALREMNPHATDNDIEAKVDQYFQQEDACEYHLGCPDASLRKAGVFALGAFKVACRPDFNGDRRDEFIRRLELALAAAQED